MTEAQDPGPGERLEILKALGDNTRYAIYLEVARSPRPRSTSEIAETLQLHPNTVRPHLERMREVGLLTIASDARGGVGRPQHLYSVAPEAPSLGFEPPAFPRLARMMMAMAEACGAGADEAVAAGSVEGRADAKQWRGRGRTCLDALTGQLELLGFDPTALVDGDGATVAFAHCPFRELAESHPELVCSLHRGMVEGFVDEMGGGRVQAFRSLVDRNPCQVELGHLEPPDRERVVVGSPR